MFKVLVVDDDEEILKMMRIALEMKNYEVTTYSFVSLPLNIKEFQGYDLILLDVMMSKILKVPKFVSEYVMKYQLLSFLLAQKIQRKI